MSLVTVKDFGIALSISGGTIRSKISRGQLLRNKKGYIDTENPTNYIYLLEVNNGDQSVFEKYHQGVVVRSKIIKKSNAKEKTLHKGVSSIVKGEKRKESKNKERSGSEGSVNITPVVETVKKVLKEVTNKLSQEEKQAQKQAKDSRETLYNLELRKKTADAELKERESELKQIQLEKIAGNTLPLDVTRAVLTINLQSILSTFKAELENMAAISVEILGGTREDLVRITNDQDIMLKKLIEIAKTNADAEIEKYVMEYSEVRSRGERK